MAGPELGLDGFNLFGRLWIGGCALMLVFAFIGYFGLVDDRFDILVFVWQWGFYR